MCEHLCVCSLCCVCVHLHVHTCEAVCIRPCVCEHALDKETKYCDFRAQPLSK